MTITAPPQTVLSKTVPSKTVASIRWLAAPTSWSWVEQANARPMEVLIDHAHCERKRQTYQGGLDATEVLAGQLRQQPRQAVHQAGDQEQHDPGHTEEQAHQQSNELPAVVFGVGEEVRLRKPTQLGGLIAQVLKLVGHATAELCSVWLSPRRFAADLNREATPEDAHRSRAHGGETPSGQHQRR